jgi:hypothetical protein
LSFEVADGFAASESNIIADVKRGGRYDTSGIVEPGMQLELFYKRGRPCCFSKDGVSATSLISKETEMNSRESEDS